MIPFLHPGLLPLLSYVLFCYVLSDSSRVKAGGEKGKGSREGEQESYYLIKTVIKWSLPSYLIDV